ncbi:molybdenum cofactor guanylyltransferase [Methanoregula sp.]|jgi:molybdopterin-guanine dinucleotide biosynthesis protein A|uniref:molybdenum cofactor guanylyltransferase n=1 Tax=Methanoregula sp. TaxID=2052170 RepID=UPI003566ED13
MRSAVILAGGEARRANGQEKYFFTYEGKTFIERLVGSLSGVVDEIVIVARNPVQCTRFREIDGVTCISDIRQGLGPIGGLHAGSLAAKGELVFVSACDMPCIETAVISYLFEAIGQHEAVIPQWNEWMLEPLHAVYRRTALLTYLEGHTSLSLRAMIQSMDTRYIPVDELRAFDPDLRTFTNINKLEELEHINRSSSEEFGEKIP